MVNPPAKIFFLSSGLTDSCFCWSATYGEELSGDWAQKSSDRRYWSSCNKAFPNSYLCSKEQMRGGKKYSRKNSPKATWSSYLTLNNLHQRNITAYSSSSVNQLFFLQVHASQGKANLALHIYHSWRSLFSTHNAHTATPALASVGPQLSTVNEQHLGNSSCI